MSPPKALSIVHRVPGGWKVIAVIGLAFLLGFVLGGGDDGPVPPGAGQTASAAAPTVYTCSMHPQIRLPDPKALCPICGMALIPVTGGSDDDGPPRTLSMSENAKALADIETAPVERSFVVKEVRMVGTIDYDETHQRTITAWVPGRLDRLYVDYTGVAVRQGAPMAYMYSPELLVAQQALLKADQAYEEMSASGVDDRNLRLQQGTLVALVDRLRLWGLSDEQIVAIREQKTASDHMTVLSPISGIVIRKNAVEGDYVQVGSRIYEIADLSRVWVYLDAYESDLSWIRYAQEVQFEAEAYPGEEFRGRISFIDPFLDKKTRTVKVRVTVDNVDGRLKPGMFVRARVLSTLADGGKIAEPSLADKWISPVHPEYVADGPGECAICGTPLVPAESLGYVGSEATPPLAVPATAVLITGKRALVYVRVPDRERPTFEGREVTLGARTKDHYLVVGGLEEGEQVVVRGSFKIDSALQILARPSMMSPPREGGAAPRLEVPIGFVSGLSPLFHAYLEVKTALSEDDPDAARLAAEATLAAAKTVQMRLLKGPAHERWMELAPEIAAGASQCEKALDLESARASFELLSTAMLQTVRSFGQATGSDLHEQHCPMAFDNRGASWLSESKEILNPYFGASMLRCGKVRETFPAIRIRAIPRPFLVQLSGVVDAYLGVGNSLFRDEPDGARQGATALKAALAKVDADLLEPDARGAWRRSAAGLRDAVGAMESANTIEESRRPFALVSSVLAQALSRFGHAGPDDLVRVHCGMAFGNRGADWVQRTEEIRNPYFGAAMPGCGEVESHLPAQPREE